MDNAFFDSELFRVFLLPLLIFVARIVDVSIGTIRIIAVSRGQRLLAPLLGFFEVLIWILAIGQIMKNLSSVWCYLAYAGGFAAGNYVGMYFESLLAMGIYVVRVITVKEADELATALRMEGFGITEIDANGANGAVKIIFSVIKRKEVDTFLQFVKKFNPNAFYTVEDVRAVSSGIFLAESAGGISHKINVIRKGK